MKNRLRTKTAFLKEVTGLGDSTIRFQRHSPHVVFVVRGKPKDAGLQRIMLLRDMPPVLTIAVSADGVKDLI